MQSLMSIHYFPFEIQTIKNDFTGAISYQVFRETGPTAGLFKAGWVVQSRVMPYMPESLQNTALAVSPELVSVFQLLP